MTALTVSSPAAAGDAVQHLSHDKMRLRRDQGLAQHQIIHPHPEHAGIARRLGLDHDPLDYRPSGCHFRATRSRGPEASEVLPVEGLEGARRQFDRKDDIVVGSKKQRSRPLYRPIERLRVALGFNRAGRHILGATRNMHDVLQNPLSAFASA